MREMGDSSGVVLTNRPWRRTGIPSDAHRWTTEAGWPKKAAMFCQPVSASNSFLGVSRFLTRFRMTILGKQLTLRSRFQFDRLSAILVIVLHLVETSAHRVVTHRTGIWDE
jgi:hypothetical protein